MCYDILLVVQYASELSVSDVLIKFPFILITRDFYDIAEPILLAFPVIGFFQDIQEAATVLQMTANEQIKDANANGGVCVCVLLCGCLFCVFRIYICVMSVTFFFLFVIHLSCLFCATCQHFKAEDS